MKACSTNTRRKVLCRLYSSFAATSNHSQSRRNPVKAYPQSATRSVPSHIRKPSYAISGRVPFSPNTNSIKIHDKDSIRRMREAAVLARQTLDLACSMAEPGVSTDSIDAAVHDAIVLANAYPSPLNYEGFPKSSCSSVNEVVCHGIPDMRPLEFGDVVSFDVSCFVNGVHGDNCATVIAGDHGDSDVHGVDWRGVPYRYSFDDKTEETRFNESRRLVHATRESLYAGIEACRPGGCLTHVGAAIHSVADAYGYDTVRKYRGHGIGEEFHCAPFVRHFRHQEKVELRPGMIFTIEPMLTEGSQDSDHWDDNWTVVTADGRVSAQFEHTVLITDSGVEILTVVQ